MKTNALMRVSREYFAKRKSFLAKAGENEALNVSPLHYPVSNRRGNSFRVACLL
jgi:hypothetical protein